LSRNFKQLSKKRLQTKINKEQKKQKEIVKLVWKWTAVLAVVMFLGACENGPTSEELRLAKIGAAASLINKPDPEKLRMKEVAKQYNEFIINKIEEYNLPGAAYAIVKDGEVVSINTYGVCCKTKTDCVPVDEHTVFRLASVSKGFASVLAGILVDKGHFDWNDKVKDHLPSFRLKKSATTNNLTIRHTLSHTTGLQKYAGSKWISKGLSYPSILKNLKHINIQEKPAKVYAYQNAIFSVISEITKVTTKFSYEKMIDSLIFSPLAMNDASVGYEAMMATENKGYPHVSKMKRGKRTWKNGKVRTNWYNVAPAAGINASISDMAIWLKAMLGHYPDVLPKAALEEVFKPHIPINDDSGYYESWAPGLTQASYGMGWRIFDYNDHKIVYHGGWVRGYRPEMGFCPKEDVGIVFLTNASKNDLSSMCVREFFDMYFAPKVSS